MRSLHKCKQNPAMFTEFTPEEITSAVEGATSELLWEISIDGPPVDAFEVAHRVGLTVAEDRALRGRARYIRLGHDDCRAGGGTILLASEARPERRQWSVAHEVGEFVSQRVFDRLGIEPHEAPLGSREGLANRLAGTLLLPRRWFLPDADTVDWDLRALKRLYPTASHELIGRRMLELYRGAAVVTVFDQGDVAWRRASRSPAPPHLSEPEHLVWSHCHRREADTQEFPLLPGIARVRCWPIHEPGWRREILLTELEDFDAAA